MHSVVRWEMQIRYERPLPELTFEVAAPLHLSLGPDLETVVDKWSLDGIHPPKQLAGGSRFWEITRDNCRDFVSMGRSSRKV